MAGVNAELGPWIRMTSPRGADDLRDPRTAPLIERGRELRDREKELTAQAEQLQVERDEARQPVTPLAKCTSAVARSSFSKEQECSEVVFSPPTPIVGFTMMW